MAIEKAAELLDKFKSAAQRVGLFGSDFEIKHKLLTAPHRPPTVGLTLES